MNTDNNLLENNSNSELTEREIFTRIWTSPRLVFKFLNDYQFDKYVWGLLILAGIAGMFDNAATRNMGDYISLPAVLFICIFFGSMLGWIGYYIYAALLSWTGKWLKGQGDTNSLLRMIAYALLPSIAAMLLLFPQIAMFGNGLFQSELDIYGNGSLPVILFYLFVLLELALFVWTIVFFVIGVSEIQKLSIGKSILNIILPALIIIVPIVLIAFILGNMFG